MSVLKVVTPLKSLIQKCQQGHIPWGFAASGFSAQEPGGGGTAWHIPAGGTGTDGAPPPSVGRLPSVYISAPRDQEATGG